MVGRGTAEGEVATGMRKGAWRSGPGIQVSVRAAEGESASDDDQKQAAGEEKKLEEKARSTMGEQEAGSSQSGERDDVVVVIFVMVDPLPPLHTGG